MNSACNARWFVTFTFLLLMVDAAHAEKPFPTKMAHCAQLLSGVDRLLCYDKIAQSLTTNTSRVESDPEITQLKVASPPVNEIGSKYLSKGIDSSKPTKNVFFQLLKIEKDKRGKTEFHFGNGQIWRQTEARYVREQKPLPMQVEIIHSVLGSFTLRLGNKGRLVKVKRIK